MSGLVNASLISNSVNKLRTSIEEFNTQTAIQNKRMHRLTSVITILTLVMIVAVGAQVYFNLNQNLKPQSAQIVPNLSMTYTEYLEASAAYKAKNAKDAP